MTRNVAPKVSVIIPTYNQAHYIREAIDSVLAQTYDDYEIIVIDDGSTDDTRRQLIPYGGRINYVYQANRGVGSAKNSGVCRAKGKYVAFLDSDDVWLPDKLRIQTAILDAEPDLAFVCSQAYVFTDKEGRVGLWSKENDKKESFDDLREENFVAVLTVLIRKHIFSRAGGFDESLANAQDYDLWLRLAKNGARFRHIDIPLAGYRRHTGNNTKNTDRRARSIMTLLGKKEIWSSMPVLKKRIRFAAIYYGLAQAYLSKRRYYKAARYYLKSVFMHPAVGCHIPTYPEQRSFLYKFIRVYYLILKCCLQPPAWAQAAKG